MDCPNCGWDCAVVLGKWECATCGWRSAAAAVILPAPDECRKARDWHTEIADALTTLPLDVLPEDMQTDVRDWYRAMKDKAEHWDDLLHRKR